MMAVRSEFRSAMAATFGVAALLLGCAIGAARAQDAAVAPPAATDEVKADWTTFAKAIGAVYGSVTFGYEADTDLSVAAKGLSIKGKQKTKFLAQRPDKVRSEVETSLGDDLKDARKYVSVTDGTTFWVNRLDKPRYSATPVEKVKLSEDLNGMGLLGSLYLNRDLMGGLSSLTEETAPQLLPEFKKMNVDLTKGVEMLNGKRVPVYTMTIAAMKLSYKFFVDTVSSNLSCIELNAKDTGQGFELKMVEKLTRMDKQPAVKDSLFVFTPMAGLEKMKDKIPVDLFHE